MKKILLLILFLISLNAFGANRASVRERLNKNIEVIESLIDFTLEEAVRALSNIFARNNNYIALVRI